MYLAAWLNSPPKDLPKISIRQSQPQQPDPVGDKLTFFIVVEIFIIILQAQIIFLCVPLSRVLSFFLFFSCPIVLPSLPQRGPQPYQGACRLGLKTINTCAPL